MKWPKLFFDLLTFSLFQEHFIKLAEVPTYAHLVDNNLHFVFEKPRGMGIVTYTFDTKKFTEGEFDYLIVVNFFLEFDIF